ncbi:hypothetical protein Tco_0162943 [Tanacetum coccineum]
MAANDEMVAAEDEKMVYLRREDNVSVLGVCSKHMSYTTRKSVAPVRNRILIYPDSDEEDEEYCSLPPLLPCFQTPQPCATFNSVHHNSNKEVDIDNMTLEEYARYEVAMSNKKNETINTTHGFTSQFFNQPHHTPNPPLDKEDSTLDEILDDLFKIGAENLRKRKHKVPHRYDDKIVDITNYEESDHKDGKLHVLPIFSATNEFASVCEQVEENIDVNTAQELEEDQVEDVEMDEDNNIDHSNTEEILDILLLAKFMLLELVFLQLVQVDAHGVVLGLYLDTWKHFKSGLVGYHADEDDGHSEVDIENTTLKEYARYELAMSTMKSEIQVPTQGFTSQFFNQSQHTPKPPLDKDEILDDLFKIEVENIRKMEHEVPNRCDDITDYEDSDQEDGELPDLPIRKFHEPKTKV